MTMIKREKPSIWSLVREDRDIDDIIFGTDCTYSQDEQSHSDR